MKLKELAGKLSDARLMTVQDVDITGISFDSRDVKEGHLFVAWKGIQLDGREYLEEALRRGAAAICIESEEGLNKKIPVLVVPHARNALADLSCAFYRYPAHELNVIGVTGTNGKTTVSSLTHSILNACEIKAGLLGTIQYHVGNRIIPAERTTPESLFLQRYFREMLDAQSKAVVMEVSSHSLALDRVRGIPYKTAIFTQLSQDHLDFHGNSENYFQAKAKLFRNLSRDSFAIINADCPYGQRLAEMTSATVVTYGFSKKSMVRTSAQASGERGSKMLIVFPQAEVEMTMPLWGRFNILNILAAFSAGWTMKLDVDKIVRSIESFQGVPGRMEFIKFSNSVSVIVDYAHTEDALRNVLMTLRSLTRGRLITVFGCGGNRDSLKRPKMGEAAGLLSDYVIVTSDNPRYEEPEVIIHEIELGVQKSPAGYEKITDRRAAIERALSLARDTDMILIAGKGHEKFQEIGMARLPFDDVAVVKEMGSFLYKSRDQKAVCI